ncbi:MAG: YpmS family protein [Streptococcaceae bacterium]|nr:YpmS family protein [Streptococcaceae bacterium]
MAKKINGYKWAFLTLVALILGTAIFVFVSATTNAEPNIPDYTKANFSGSQVATITTTRTKVNELINAALEDFQDERTSYKFYLENEAVFEGTFRFLEQDFPIYLYFEPIAQNDGNIELRIKSISIGTLALPTDAVMRLVSGSIELPPYVVMDAQKEIVTIRLDELKLPNGLQVKAENIDLVNDRLSFQLLLK